MKKESKDIPSWLLWPTEAEPPDRNLLNESRKEIYEALSLFFSHVKYVIYIMVSMPAAILVIMRLWPTDQSDSSLHFIAGIILIAVLFVGIISIGVIYRYYQVYISALVFATRVHIAYDYTQIHPWLERTIKQAQKLSSVNNSLDFIGKRAWSLDTFILYAIIIFVLSIASFLAGIWLLCLSGS